METTKSSLLTTKQVAKILNCAEGTLHNHRSRCVGIPYYKIGKKVVYHVKDVEDYLRKQRVEPEG
jgi:hypothetical protein